MKREMMSGEKKRDYSRKKDQWVLIWQMGLFLEI